jgi:hypothetical protein
MPALLFFTTILVTFVIILARLSRLTPSGHLKNTLHPRVLYLPLPQFPVVLSPADNASNLL